VQDLICAALRVYIFVIFARIILSWFPIQAGTGLAQVYGILHDLTEPVMGPVRRLIPPIGGGGMAFDLSPIVVIVGITILQGALCS
jgi:YggT family protein